MQRFLFTLTLTFTLTFTLPLPLTLASAIAANPFLPYVDTASDSISLLIDRDGSYRYGYAHFSSTNEKLLYNQVIDSICTFTANGKDNGWIENRVFVYPSAVGATNPGINTYMKMLYRMKNDMPELYVMSNYIPRYTADYQGYQVRLFLSYTPSLYASELAVIDSVVSGIIDRTEMMSSDYEKVLYLHDTLCQITRYGDMSGAYAGTIKGVFINHRAVCEGWARAFLYLCQKTGIECLYIDGAINTTPDEATPTWGNHAWNHVQVDGHWYLVDATSDGALGTVGHRAFLKGQTYFDSNYTYITQGDDANHNLTAYPTLPTLHPTDYGDPTHLEDSNVSPSITIRKIMDNNSIIIVHHGLRHTILGLPIR